MARSRTTTHGPMIKALQSLSLGLRPRILDAGMGAGCLGERIRQAFPNAELTGADCWLRYLVDPICRQTAGWPSLSLYDTLVGGRQAQLPGFFESVSPGSYDAIVLGDVLEHLQPHEARQCLDRARAIATAGVVVNTPIREYPQGAMWDNASERHQFWWPRRDWEALGGEWIGGDDSVGCFLFRAQPRQAPQLSVIIPTFNRRSYVDMCVRSLLRTDSPPWRFEIIVVDDGSVDGTDEHVRREFGHLNVRLVRRTVNVGKPNCPGLARNVGLRTARGKRVAFLDCDVIHCRDPIAAMLKVDHNAHWRCWGRWMLETALVEGGTTFRGGMDQLIPAQMWWGTERKNLIDIGGFDERFIVYGAEDLDMYARLGRQGLKIEHLPGQYAVGMFAPRNAGPRNVIDVEQNERQHRMWRDDQSIVRNQGVDWGKQHVEY